MSSHVKNLHIITSIERSRQSSNSSSPKVLSLHTTMPNILPMRFGAVDAGVLLASACVLYLLAGRFRSRRTTSLKGPSSGNFLFGVMGRLINAPDSGAIYEEWATLYGSVFSIPSFLGSRDIVFADPKAINHLYSKETYGYVQTPQGQRAIERLIGRGLLWAEGNSHKRQRRTLNPAFGPASIKNLTPIFFESAFKATSAWDSMLESSSDGVIIEVQNCLDTIGLAGFSHDFGTLSGKTSDIATVFDSIGSKPSMFNTVVFLLSFIVPIFDKIPTGRQTNLDLLTKTLRGLASNFLATTGDAGTTDKSVIGLLAKSASAQNISEEEVVAQWALIELSRNPSVQTKLRDELLQAGRDRDLTWEELTNNLPFLDAFTCEILRLHPPVQELRRIAAEDDFVPLSSPIETVSGGLADTIFVAKGTVVAMPIECMNRSVEFWGPDAKVFNPSRWLDTSSDHRRAQEIKGYRHVLTFSDGARMCLGKGFALTEFKAVLSVLSRNYTFELPNGPETVIGRHRNLLLRPKVEGEEGYRVPLRIRHYMSE
ncbi:cytochrome P450 [Mycena rosella]|uniref:Cytochrome P450 n=1 Tax=Mycena rosella TaxID=1033263 RepID=A0AAD7GX40_MYCRO|nr:cytochrome P450 [Mycena rosella]